jgi:TctA family transporter
VGDEHINQLLDFLKENNKNQEAYRKENNVLMREQTGAIVKMSTMIENLDRVLQTKPCIVKPKTEKLEQGWRDSSVTTYKWIIGSLIGLIIGILTSVGLYSTHIVK